VSSPSNLPANARLKTQTTTRSNRLHCSFSTHRVAPGPRQRHIAHMLDETRMLTWYIVKLSTQYSCRFVCFQLGRTLAHFAVCVVSHPSVSRVSLHVRWSFIGYNEFSAAAAFAVGRSSHYLPILVFSSCLFVERVGRNNFSRTCWLRANFHVLCEQYIIKASRYVPTFKLAYCRLLQYFQYCLYSYASAHQQAKEVYIDRSTCAVCDSVCLSVRLSVTASAAE